jgi:hypothetical protein
MNDISEAERLRLITNLQTNLVLHEVQLAEEAIGRNLKIFEDAEYDEDNAKVFHVSHGRPTALSFRFCAAVADCTRTKFAFAT